MDVQPNDTKTDDTTKAPVDAAALAAELDQVKADLAKSQAALETKTTELATATKQLDEAKTKLTSETERGAQLQAQLDKFAEARKKRLASELEALSDEEKALVNSLGGDDEAATLRALDALKGAGKIGTPAPAPEAPKTRPPAVPQTRLGSKDTAPQEPPKTSREAAERTAQQIQERIKAAQSAQ